MSDQWGPGSKEHWRYKDETVLVDGRIARLFSGEHPHSRSDNNLYAELERDHVVGFSGHRVCTRVDVVESNYLKQSGLSGDDVRGRCEGLLYMNDRLVYGRQFGDVKFALLWFAANMHEFFEHPVQLWLGQEEEFPDLVGRKVYWKGVPAIVAHYFQDQGGVVVDAAKGFEFVIPSHETLAETEERETSIKDDLLSDSFGWFREEATHVAQD